MEYTLETSCLYSDINKHKQIPRTILMIKVSQTAK